MKKIISARCSDFFSHACMTDFRIRGHHNQGHVLIFPPFADSPQAACPVSVFIPGWSTEEENFMYFCVMLISEKEKEVTYRNGGLGIQLLAARQT